MHFAQIDSGQVVRYIRPMPDLEENKNTGSAALAACGEREALSAAATEAKRLLGGRRCILRGFLLLLLGSLFLLTCKTPLPGFFTEILAFLGGAIMLLGNGYILFGLLIFADARHS